MVAMQGITPEMMPQIITGIVVSLCVLFATFAVNRASKKLENIATKDYVKAQLDEHSRAVKTNLDENARVAKTNLDEQTRKMGEMFVRAAEQSEINAVIEQRMKYLEDQIWARFERMVEMIRPKTIGS